MSKTWIIVAESSRARIFSLVSKHEPLVELEDLLNPSARVHESELASDAPGRTVGSGGIQHALESEVSPKDAAADAFAKQIADKIDHARGSGEVGEILLAASPKFLGLLKGHLTEQSERLVSASLDKDLVEMGESEIREHFFA